MFGNLGTNTGAFGFVVCCSGVVCYAKPTCLLDYQHVGSVRTYDVITQKCTLALSFETVVFGLLELFVRFVRIK